MLQSGFLNTRNVLKRTEHTFLKDKFSFQYSLRNNAIYNVLCKRKFNDMENGIDKNVSTMELWQKL